MLKFKKLDERAILPTRAKEGDAGLDLYAIENVIIPPCKFTKTLEWQDGKHKEYFVTLGQVRVPTGIAVEIPKGFYGKVSSRSGLAFKEGIFSFDGTIDAPYRGEIGVLLYNTKDEPYKIKKGDRIAQLLIIPCEILQPEWADELSESERGENGFGSSGK